MRFAIIHARVLSPITAIAGKCVSAPAGLGFDFYAPAHPCSRFHDSFLPVRSGIYACHSWLSFVGPGVASDWLGGLPLWSTPLAAVRNGYVKRNLYAIFNLKHRLP